MVELSGGEPDPFQPVPAINDQVLAFRNQAHVPSKALGLLALAGSGGGVAAATLMGARVQSPKTVISPAYVRPVNNTALAVFPSDPNISVFADRPIQMREGEEISAMALAEGPGPGPTTTPVGG